MTEPTSDLVPNHYELRGEDLVVTYSTTSIDGQPRLSYQAKEDQRSFAGDEITTTETGIGTVLTVTLEAVPDLSRTDFSVLIPAVILGDAGTAAVCLPAVTTVTRTAISPQHQDPGQLSTYAVTTLDGTASVIEA